MDFTTKEVIEMILSFLFGSGLSFHFTRKHYIKKQIQNEQTQKNGSFSKNNVQIGEINVRK